MRTAVVTGGSRGIGKEIALRLGKTGFNIAVIYAGNVNAANEVCKEVLKFGVKALAYQCDVSNSAQVKEISEKIIADFGGVDVLVNNAGITRDNLALRMTDQEFDEVIAVNLKGVFNCTKNFMRPIMKSAAGRIINLSSVSGITGNIGQANYSASKAAVIGFTKTMAKELAGKGVAVNAVAPGFIDTDMTAGLDEKIKEYVKSAVPFKRMGTATEVAAVVNFLASESASYITGQTIVVDGGLAM